jgi:hypothetical protein
MLLKNFKVTKKQVVTRRREYISEVVAENEEQVKKVIEKERNQDIDKSHHTDGRLRDLGCIMMTNPGYETLISIDEEIIIEEVK